VGTEHVHAVVVGSGFGGSVSAFRLAEAGRSVVVLERGRPYPPGSFPRTPQEMGAAFWDPSEKQYGLFDVWRFTGFDSLISSGLGGGSLIYANVMLRKDEKWFVREEPMPDGGYENWPITRADLDPHYDAVEKMLGANPYPLAHAAFRDTPKTHAMIMAAEKNGLDWQLPPLAISFTPTPGAEPGVGLPIVPPAYGNIHGVARRTCRLTGECDIGCNDGAKNTLDHTYLSAAKYHGADIRTGCEVRGIQPLSSGGYKVSYLRYDLTGNGPATPLAITCDKLILGAGAYGTTYLLLRNRVALPGLSAALGTRFSGNGDLLTFLLPKLRIGTGASKTEIFDASHGPVITAAIRMPDTVDGGPGRGFYIEDGGYPGFVDWLVEASDLTGNAFRLGELVVRWALERITRSPQTHFNSEMSALLGKGTLAAGSLPLLGMGRDIPDGVLKLRDGYLDVKWTTATSMAYFTRVRDTMRELARTLDVEYVDNPIWFFKKIITVHPVGGSPMGRNEQEGICDSYGEVFHHPGLHIADGAVMPGPVGTNPSLTIAAHADRMATHILAEPARGGTRIATAPAATSTVTPIRATGQSPATSLSFTEEMTGFFALGESDPAAGERIGHDRGQRLMFHLTITATDVTAFLASPAHLADAAGWIECAALGGRLPVSQGWFNLFTPGDEANARRMEYRLHFADAKGKPLTLSGRKEVRDNSVLDIWSDTSTLYYRVLAGHVGAPGDADAEVKGAGIAHIRIEDFAHQLTTIRTTGPDHHAAMLHFGRFFLGQLWDVYGRHLPTGTGARQPEPAGARRG
jgi:cholesterol oxidase